MSFFTAAGIRAGYGEKRILHSVSFSCEAGTITGLLGANGCGKTTLLKALCGILPHEGVCTLDGTPLDRLPPRPLARLCSYIPQRSGISIDLPALDVVLMGFNPQLGLLEHPGAAMRRQAQDALDTVGLRGRADENYLTLSEGQKQLCILARTIIADSRLLLLDEPESALDFRYRHGMFSLLRSHVRHKRCALIALHDPQLALEYCDQILLIKDGAVCSVLRPQTDSVETMERALSLIYGSVSLARCQDRAGTPHLVMLKTQEDFPCSP